jgi:flagellar hook-basal body complex protein FliE
MSAGIGGIGGSAAGVRDIIALRQQIIDRSQLLQQIHAGQSADAVSAASTATPTQATPASGFAETLKTALGHVEDTQAQAEAIGNAYERGDVTDVAKVMLARQEAGVAFEATLQVRNRLLSAYQDIMRMGV